MSAERLRNRVWTRWASHLRELVIRSLVLATVVVLGLVAVVGTSDGPGPPTIQDLVYKGDEAGVRRELDRRGGADVNAAQPGSGLTPLMIAARRGHIGTARLLLARGADVRLSAGSWGSALTCAASFGDPNMVRLLLDHRSDPNLPMAWGGISPLMAAADLGHDDAAAVLIAAGARVNSQNSWGRSALMFAASGGHDRTVQLLLAAGADRTARDCGGESAADQARHEGHRGTAQLLLAREAPPRA
jgi:ankyrin repeat protein